MITPRSILMVKPWDFTFNEESAISNTFQKKVEGNVNSKALKEFEAAVDQIQQSGIDVLVFDKKSDIKVPDAVFPNNWIGFHPDGKVILYPMMHENRRNERNTDVLDLLDQKGHKVKEVVDLSFKEEFGEFLEGTGSMVIDYKSKIAYACTSPRTEISLFSTTAKSLNLEAFSFNANDLQGRPIYHTNVLLSITEKLAVVCLECIDNSIQRMMLKKKLEESGLEIIEISYSQMEHFCGNVFEVKNRKDESFIIGSSTAWNAFTSDQRSLIEKYHSPIIINIPSIETVGGGSARCMVAGVYF